MNNQLFIETIPKKTSELLDKLIKLNPKFLKDFYLSGGTALSLQLGHRESEDLDFFCQNEFDPRLLQKDLEKIGSLENIEIDKNTLNTFISGVKLQFLGYPYSLIDKFEDFNGINLSSVLDIACTKLQTIGMRGSKKDFVDLYELFIKYDLPFLLSKMKIKYVSSEFNIPHILKSLVYFDDAKNQPMPRLHHKNITWETVKAKMIQTVKKYPLGARKSD